MYLLSLPWFQIFENFLKTGYVTMQNSILEGRASKHANSSKAFQSMRSSFVAQLSYSTVITEQANFAHAIFTFTMGYEVPLFN